MESKALLLFILVESVSIYVESRHLSRPAPMSYMTRGHRTQLLPSRLPPVIQQQGIIPSTPLRTNPVNSVTRRRWSRSRQLKALPYRYRGSFRSFSPGTIERRVLSENRRRNPFRISTLGQRVPAGVSQRNPILNGARIQSRGASLPFRYNRTTRQGTRTSPIRIRSPRIRQLLRHERLRSDHLRLQRSQQVRQQKSRQVRLQKTRQAGQQSSRQVRLQNSQQVRQQRSRQVRLKNSPKVPQQRSRQVRLKKSQQVRQQTSRQVRLKNSQQVRQQTSRQVHLQRPRQAPSNGRRIRNRKSQQRLRPHVSSVGIRTNYDDDNSEGIRGRQHVQVNSPYSSAIKRHPQIQSAHTGATKLPGSNELNVNLGMKQLQAAGIVKKSQRATSNLHPETKNILSETFIYPETADSPGKAQKPEAATKPELITTVRNEVSSGSNVEAKNGPHDTVGTNKKSKSISRDGVPVLKTAAPLQSAAVESIVPGKSVVQVGKVIPSESVVLVDTVVPVDSVVSAETTIPVDTVVPVDGVVPVKSIVPVESVAPVQSVVPLDSNAPVKYVAPTETAIFKILPVDSVETAIAVDTISSVESVAPVKRFAPIEDVVPVESVASVETAIAVDTLVQTESVAPVDSVVPVDNVVPIESVAPVVSAVPVDNIVPIESVGPEDTVMLVESVVPVESVVLVDSIVPAGKVDPDKSISPEYSVVPVDTTF